MFEHRILPTDPRFLDFTFIGADGNNYRVKFSDLDKVFSLSVKEEIIAEGTVIVLTPNRFRLFNGSIPIIEIIAQELRIISGWEWYKHIRGGNITINADNAFKAKQKQHL